MKPFLLSLLAITITTSSAESKRTVRTKELEIDGETYTNVEIWKEDESQANYKFSGGKKSGFGMVDMKKLPPDIQKALGYDAGKQQEATRKAADDRKKAATEKKAMDSAPAITSVALSAKTGSAGTETTENWKSAWGSHEKDIDQQRSIAVRLRNGTDNPGVVYLETIWLTNGADGKGQVSGIARVGRSKMQLKSRETATGTVTGSFGRTDNKYKALGVSQMSGKGFGGWIVRAVDPNTGKVLAIQAMREPLKPWAEKVPVGKKGDF